MTATPTTDRPLAVVTGASSGIGYALAKQFVENGYDVVVNSEDPGIVDAAAALATDGAVVQPVLADLTTSDGVQRLYDEVLATGRPVDAIAINAGIGVSGAFVDNDLEDELELIDLNVVSSVRLAKLVLRDMVARDKGKVLITSSIAATTPMPYQAVYAASKAFLRSFSEGLQYELRDTGVSVTALMPGPTDTEFFERAGAQDTAMDQMSKDDPDTVAQQGFKALMAGKDFTIAGGLKTKVMAQANKATPEGTKAKIQGKLSEPGSGQ